MFKCDVSYTFLGLPDLMSCQLLPFFSSKCHLIPILLPILHSLWASYHLPYFFYYRNLLILIMPPTTSFSHSHHIIHVADKLIIKHPFNLSFATRRLQSPESQTAQPESVGSWHPQPPLPTSRSTLFIDMLFQWTPALAGNFPGVVFLLKPISCAPLCLCES